MNESMSLSFINFRQHPWFTLHLPRYLAVMQAGTVTTSAAVDPEIVEEVSRLIGNPTENVAESVRGKAQDKVCTLRHHSLASATNR